MKRLILISIFFLIASAHAITPPPANDVFKFTAEWLDPNAFELKWDIQPGFFLYRDKIHLTTLPNDPFHFSDTHYPKAIKKTDQQGHILFIYRNKMTLIVPVLGDKAGEGLFNIGYQGCSDDGFCYPPENQQLKLTFNDQHALTHIEVEQKSINTLRGVLAGENTDALHQLFKTNNWLLIFFSFFGFGILLSFTPCVLPMIPVLSGIILGQGKKLSTHKAFLLSLSYILSMASTYAIIGAGVALLGSNLQIFMQAPWIIATFSGIFILLALSMFGFYDLRLPTTWQHKLASFSHSKAGGAYLGAAIMGCLSTLILSPCVTAPLIGALGYIANTGDVIRGGVALFFLGVGMGTPLLLIGTSAGKWVPRAGEWMNAIKSFFGLLLLAVAIQLLGRIIPAAFIMGLWASLLIFTGIYSGALTHARSNAAKFRQGVGVITLIYGILILIGVSLGSRNPLQPLIQERTTTTSATTSTRLTLKTIAAVTQALTHAQEKQQPVILDFYANWCITCKQIDATTLKNPDINQALRRFVFIHVDVTDNNNDSQALLRHFNVVAPPTFIFYNEKGQEQSHLRLVGEISPTMLMHSLDQVVG